MVHKRGFLSVDLTVIVPGDSGTHYYDIQFRFVSRGGDGSTGSYATIGSSTEDEAAAILYITNSDLI